MQLLVSNSDFTLPLAKRAYRYNHIIKHIQGWISSCRSLMDEVEIPKLNKEAFILETRRMWTFTKALLLDDTACVDQHSELLSKLIDAALSSGDDVSPFISIARLLDGSQTLKMKLIARSNADMNAVHNLVMDIATIVGGCTRGPARDSASEGILMNTKSVSTKLMASSASLASLQSNLESWPKFTFALLYLVNTMSMLDLASLILPLIACTAKV